ncbi:MAG: bacteriohemerythrin [Deltaproteobacteria bacterium]|nr:bacteriohemerythrin [Deltaproteobacteria bacterium]
MDVFQWNKNFETGIAEVDRQHHHLVDITNKFGGLIAQDNVRPDDIKSLFEELVSYAQYHFDEEEKIMHAAGIDERHIREHEKVHQGFFQDVALLHKEVLSERSINEKDLFEFLINWLIYHMLGTDKNLARQIDAISNGISNSEAYATKEQNADVATASLLKSLNTLFNQVSSRNRQLAELNQSLESKVEQRTQALFDTNRKLEELATTDVLTGLANRRFAMQALERLWDPVGQPPGELSCMLIDADHFKEINDSFGHDAGDTVLCELAKHLRHAVRTDDIVCRLGGDEFFIICPKTDKDGLLYIAKRMHEQIAELNIPVPGGTWRGSISVGIAVRTRAMTKPEELIKAADNGVYAAKKAGKNCVKLGQ